MGKKRPSATSGHTLLDAIKLFLARYKKKSQETYGYNLKNLADFVGGDRPIARITEIHILEYQQHLYERLDNKAIATATYATYLKMCKVFFNWLVKSGQLETSPARLVKVPRTTSHIEKQKAMTDEELNRVLQWTQFKPRDHAIVLFLADTGCRAGGAAGLRVQDIDFDNLRAEVTEKGEKTRGVVFDVRCAAALKDWLRRRPTGAGEYVFSVTKEPLHPDIISNAVRRACKKVGVRSLGSHSLRHRLGHQLANAMVPPTLAADILGHEDADTTFKSYYPTSRAEAERVARRFSVKGEESSRPAGEQGQPRETPRLIVLKKGG